MPTIDDRIILACSACGARFKGRRGLVGRRGQCPKCGLQCCLLEPPPPLTAMPKTGKTTEWIPPEIDDDKVYRQCGKCGEIIEDLSRLAGLHKSCPKCGQSSETTNACTPPAKAGTTPPEPNVFLPSFVCQKCGEKTNGAAVRINGKWEYLHKCQTSKQTNLTATKIGESVPLTKRDEARAKPSSPKTGKALFVVIGFFILFTPMILDAWGIVYIHFIVQILIGFPVLLSLGLVEEWYEGVKNHIKKWMPR